MVLRRKKTFIDRALPGDKESIIGPTLMLVGRIKVPQGRMRIRGLLFKKRRRSRK